MIQQKLTLIKNFFKKMAADYLEAITRKDFRKTYYYAESGNKHAQYSLAQMYEVGTVAAEKNLVLAYYLYSLSFKKGVKSSKEKLDHLTLIMTKAQLDEAKGRLRNLT